MSFVFVAAAMAADPGDWRAGFHLDGLGVAFSTTYLEDGARLVESPTLISDDYEKFVPGTQPGDRIATDRNPVLFRACAVSA